MKGFVVVSSSRNLLTHRRDEDYGLALVGWTNEIKSAVRFASEKQAEEACRLFPLAKATVERAESFTG